jgi:hypothetical protein
MKWLKKLLSFGAQQKAEVQVQNIRKIGSRIIGIRSLDMIGPYAESPNGQYLLVLQDSDRKSGVGGYRHSGNGKFALVNDDKVLFQGECERPTEGEVANNGIFIICDTLFGDQLASKLYVYAPNGEKRFSYSFSANTNSIGISDNGQLVAVQLCNSKSDDSSKLFIFDIDRAQKICSFIPQTGWANSYKFIEPDGVVYLCYQNNRRYRYSIDGNFLDSDRYEKERVEDASSTDLVFIVKKKIKETSQESLPSLLALLDLAFKGNLSEYPDYSALAYRLKGEIHDALNNYSEAIAAYRQAIEIDPKIGVKSRLKKLEKENH